MPNSMKEEFFRTKLIPAGQVAEVYLHNASSWLRKDLSQLLFETLGLVSAFAISPSTPNRKGLFASLGENVQNLIDAMRADLEALKAPKPKMGSTFSSAANSGSRRFKPLIDAILHDMKYVPEKRAKWMEGVMQTPTPLTQKGQYSKWRTFVRHIDFQENMRILGLAYAAKDMGALGSAQGREEAPLLWRECFDTVPGEADDARPAGTLLPAGVAIKSNATGLLDVHYEFDPRKVLKKFLKDVTAKVPPELDELLLTVSFDRACEFRQLPTIVDELLAWREAQLAKAEETQLKIAEFVETLRVAALRERLSKEFTDEERALMEKANIISAVIKPAAKRTPRPRKAPATPRQKRA